MPVYGSFYVGPSAVRRTPAIVPQVCLPLWEPFVLHRKHCALAASSDESSGCDVVAASVASGWLPSAAMVEEAKASSSSVWCIVGSMLDGLPLLACVRDKAKESDGRTKRQARRSHWRARTLQSPQGGQTEEEVEQTNYTNSVLLENLRNG